MRVTLHVHGTSRHRVAHQAIVMAHQPRRVSRLGASAQSHRRVDKAHTGARRQCHHPRLSGALGPTHHHQRTPSPAMAALATLLPSFLQRRKRSAEEEEARELRAALNASGRAAAVDACIELRAVNKSLTQRVDELERAAAARDDAAQHAMREVVRGELARAAKVPRWTFCAYGASEPSSDADDSAGTFGTDSERSGDETSLDSEASKDDVLRDEERKRLLLISPEELQASRINADAVSAHQTEAQAWSKTAVPTLASPRVCGTAPILFVNLRPAPVDVWWANFDGSDVACPPVPTTFYAKVSYRSWPGHLFRIYDTRSGEFLGGVRVKDADERDSAHPGTLRSLFGFDGFIGPSLRSAAEAFEARHVHFTDDDAKKQLVVIA